MVTYLGSLISVVLWGGRNASTKHHWHVWGALAVSGPHWVCPHSRCVCAILVNTAQAPGCSAELPKVSPGLRAFPRSKPLRFRFSSTPLRCRLGWACVSYTSQVRAAQVTRCLVSILSQFGGASCHLPVAAARFPECAARVPVASVPCVPSGGLISDCDPPGRCQPSRIPGRLG